jgi:hypothetical protein
MAKKAKKSARGRNQDRARVAGKQNYEVGYESKKTRKSASAVKKAVKKVGSSRKKVESALSARVRINKKRREALAG